MTWQEANLSLQFMAEERIGAPRRMELDRAKAAEDEAAAVMARAAGGGS